LLECLTGLKYSAPNNQGIGIKRVDHFVKEEAQCMGLNPENFPTHGIALIRETADRLAAWWGPAWPDRGWGGGAENREEESSRSR